MQMQVSVYLAFVENITLKKLKNELIEVMSRNLQL